MANRTYENAVRLASTFGGHAMLFEDLYREASESDIVITSTGAQEYIFRREDGREFLQQRKNRPMLFIDIAVPRDIDPAINSVEGVFLYDIDALQSVAASHLEERGREAQRAEMIVAQEAIRYHRHVQATDVRPMILELQAGAEEMRQAELRRAQSKLQSLTFEQRDAIEALTRGLMNKFLHAPLKGLKDAAEQGDREALDRLCATFNLSPVRAQLPEQEDNKDANACPLPQLNALIAC